MSKINRRNFIKVSGAGMAAMGLTPLPPGSAPSKPTELVVVEGGLIQAVNLAIVALGGISRFVKPGYKVCIHPNISFASDSKRGANTDPELVAEVSRLCVAAGAKEVLVTDNPLAPSSLCMWRSGIKEAMDKVKGATLRYISDESYYKEVSVPKGKDLKKTMLLRPLMEADLVINMPRAKTHGQTTVTLGLKNLMGISSDRRDWHSKHNLSQAIADAATVVRPQLTIIDASNVMVDNGPGGPGTLVPLNSLVVGTNPVETDALMVTLVDWNGRKYKPEEIKHLKAASEHGLGSVDIEAIKYSRLKA